MKKLNKRIIPFTDEQEAKVLTEYLKTPIKTLAREMKITEGRIRRYLERNNLTIPKEIVEQRKADSRFKKGEKAHNKGLKQSEYMSPEAIRKTAKTRFKKGNIPHNTRTDGTISIREDKTGRLYKYIRVSKGEWELYHRYLWEKANGPIQEDEIVAFKDGDTNNVTLDNLELISMAENMLRNSRHNYPSEIIPTMVLVNKLENKIKNLQNG